MADDTTVPSGESQHVSIPVTYNDMTDVPLYGCDHIIALLAPDESFILQMFSTTPPVLGGKDEPPVTKAYRKCVGQFHVTPALARQLIDMIQQQLTRLPGKPS